MRAFVTQRVGNEEKFKEIKTRLNTLWFFPDAERAILAFQGMHEIAEDDGADIAHLLAAVEYLDQPRPAQHYPCGTGAWTRKTAPWKPCARTTSCPPIWPCR